jgi:hypothetical protein
MNQFVGTYGSTYTNPLNYRKDVGTSQQVQETQNEALNIRARQDQQLKEAMAAKNQSNQAANVDKLKQSTSNMIQTFLSNKTGGQGQGLSKGQKAGNAVSAIAGTVGNIFTLVGDDHVARTANGELNKIKHIA